MGSGHKGSARKIMRKYGKCKSPVLKNRGATGDSLSSKVAKTFLGEPKNLQKASNSIDNTDTSKIRVDKILSFKRKYTNLNKKQATGLSTCILCHKNCECESIECSKCKRWYHRNCLHLTERDHQLHNLCNIRYVCLVCIIKDIPQPDCVLEIADALDEKCEEFDLLDTAPLSETEELVENNIIVEQLLQEQLATKDKSVKEGETSLLITGDSGQSQDIHFSVEVIDKRLTDNISESTPISVIDDKESGKKSENLSISGYTTSEIEPPIPHLSRNNKNSSNLIVIDNIRESWKFKNSNSIKREFNKYFKDVKLILAYSLKAGGVALHVANKESAERILKYSWPAEAFNNSGSQLYCHTAQNNPKVILKNIDAALTEKELEDIVQIFTGEKISVKRFHYRDTGKPLPVVKVTCSESAANKLLTKPLSIKGKNIPIEKFVQVHRREINCFNCRERGHIARFCPHLLKSSAEI